MTISAWYMDDKVDVDQRELHQQEPNAPVALETLVALGVTSWHFNADIHETDPELAKLRAEHGYSYMDIITISPDKLPNYEDKLRIFYKEHLHTDDEIRYCLEGSGYFDVRDKEDRWIRIAVEKGDLITLPKGIYHRFTLDAKNYMKAMRLFVGDPVWTPFNREDAGVDELPERKSYAAAVAAGGL